MSINFINKDKLQRAKKIVTDGGGDSEDEKLVLEAYKSLRGYFTGELGEKKEKEEDKGTEPEKKTKKKKK